MARNYLTRSRHGTIFYFRRRVPDDLVPIIGQPYFVKSLHTGKRREATVLARACAVQTDNLFARLRTMSKDELETYRVDFGFEIDLDEFGIARKIRGNAEPHEEAALNSAIKMTLENLPRQAGQLAKADFKTPAMGADALLDDFFKEGVAAGRWKNPETARRHDYDPIWRVFAAHAQAHGLTVEAVKAYREEVLAQAVAPETKNRNLYRVHAVIDHGVNRHDLDPRMLAHLKRPKGKGVNGGGKVKSYLPFTPDELRLLFHSDAYKTNSFKKASQFWLPMMGLYTGARLEELAGLHLSAFMTVDGVPAMLLSDDETTDEGKNEHAQRYVPIHQELLKAGLLEYCEALRGEGHQRLFPDIGEAQRDGFGKRATVDFTAYRRSVGVGKGEGERSRKVFHSFRATLASKLFQLGVDGDLSRRLTGHAAQDVHAGTYLGAAAIPMDRAAMAMEKVVFGLAHPKFYDTDAYRRARRRARAAA